MLSNGSITIYRICANRYERFVIKNCYFYWQKSQTTTQSGTITTDTATVIIPWSDAAPAVNDLVVRGICDFAFDNSTESGQSAGMKELKSKRQLYTVSSVAENKGGSRAIWHFECLLR